MTAHAHDRYCEADCVSQAKSSCAFNAGLELAAKWHEDMSTSLEPQVKARKGHSTLVNMHKSSAAAIRGLKEGE